MKTCKLTFIVCLTTITITITCGALVNDQTSNPIGVNYGIYGNNLPQPQQVVKLLQNTNVGKVKIYDANPTILQAFAGTYFDITVSVRNELVSTLVNPSAAQTWVNQNVAAHLPDIRIRCICVGNEVFNSGNQQLASVLVPAMESLHTALVTLKLDELVKVTTANSLSILSTSFPPSSGTFKPELVQSAVLPLLSFLSSTNSTFMVNAYPYFAYRNNPKDISLAYALFLPNAGVVDPGSGIVYSNMFGAMLDAVYSAMSRVRYTNLRIAVSETGWPSIGDPNEPGVSLQNAMTYNKNLIYYISTNPGTPLRPKQPIDTFIFSLFNENLKDGPASEKNFGLFRPDGSVIYDIGILRNNPAPIVFPPVNIPPPSVTPPLTSAPPYVSAPPSPVTTPPNPVTAPPSPVTTPPNPVTAPPSPITVGTPPSPVTVGTPPVSATPTTPAPPGWSRGTPGGAPVWCIAKANVDQASLIRAVNYACGEGGADCSAIQPGGPCYYPNDLASHASYAFNNYYQRHGRNYWNCDFQNNAVVAISDPSYDGCNYPARSP